MDDLVVLPEFDPDFVAPWDPTVSSPSASRLTRLDPTAASCSASATSTITTATVTVTAAQLIMPPPLPVDAFLLGLRPSGFILPRHQFDAVNGHQLPPQLFGASDPHPPRQQQQQNTGRDQHHHEHEHEPSGANVVREMGSEGRVVALRNVSHKRARTSLQSNTLVLPFSSGLKVRKEKLGDRITALQQLVSPFGKTDTASVLMEAISYIKFMQQQVQVLIMPYTTSFEQCNTDEEIDLRSRGLCLVPIPSQFINDKDDIMDCWTHSLERDLGNLCHKYRSVI